MKLSGIRALKTGVKAYGEAFSFIRKHQLGYYFLFPLSLSILLVVSGWQGTTWLTTLALEQLNSALNFEQWTFWGASILVFIIKSFIWLTFRILSLLIITYLGGYVIIILMSPVYALLSEKTAALLSQTEIPFSINQFISDIFRGVLLAIRNLLIETSLTILLLIFSFIPVIGLASAPAMLLITSYFYGFAFIDYSLERQRYGIKQSIQKISNHKGEAIGIGLPFTLVLSVPFIGSFAAAFLSIPAVVAATLMSTRHIR
ncbi:MAG: EI24 domain-containing protein [Breznakibacter sp.]